MFLPELYLLADRRSPTNPTRRLCSATPCSPYRSWAAKDVRRGAQAPRSLTNGWGASSGYYTKLTESVAGMCRSSGWYLGDPR